ncbi:MAG: CPXCG motif-containing cysteine-rich protein [Motiliproteus sp.]|nr:CPXCG motif-containing cysteine-rich protein [Motiliproteus sp.]MCW9054261.1 CPXCG motif-containing cysteine-rich protein [Motiliproteus sp.]
MLEEVEVCCPYCGEGFSTAVDCSLEQQSYYEDCQVCCAPILFQVNCDHRGALLTLEVKTDSE